MFSKVLVANRGEIAIRVFRALRELGVRVGRRLLGRRPRGAPRGATRTRRTRSAGARRQRATSTSRSCCAAVERSGAEAVHPGYGFLAENAAFARAVEAAGVVWIGPPPEAIELMGHKTAARARMQAAGVPIIPGTTEPRRLGGRDRRARRGARLPAAREGGGRRRRQGDEGRRLARRGRSRRSSPRSARARRTSPTRPSTSSATSRTRATSRCRCSPTRTAT